MPANFAKVMFTESVRAAQEREGMRELAARMETGGRDDTVLGWQEKDFVRGRDSFYLASVGDQGWPYVQHRGGPRGFLKVLDDRTLAFADFRGNRQMVSVGNVDHDDRVTLFLIDYANRRRLKILARAEVHRASDVPELAAALIDPDYPAVIERVFVYRVAAWDWNCPQHITPRFTEEEFAARAGAPAA